MDGPGGVITVGLAEWTCSGTGASAPNASLGLGGGPFNWSNIIRLRKTSEGFTISDEDRGTGSESSIAEGATTSDSHRGTSPPAMLPTASNW